MTNEPDDRVIIGENADKLGAPLVLALRCSMGLPRFGDHRRHGALQVAAQPEIPYSTCRGIAGNKFAA